MFIREGDISLVREKSQADKRAAITDAAKNETF